MLITLYVKANKYGEVDIDTEKEHQERIQNSFENDLDGDYNESFRGFLEDNYDLVNIFYLSDNEKEEVLRDYKRYYFERFDDWNSWEECEKEIEG